MGSGARFTALLLAFLRQRAVQYLLLLLGAVLLARVQPVAAVGTSSACAIDPAGYFTTLPNGPTLSVSVGCATCHISTSSVNPTFVVFGQAYKNSAILTLPAGAGDAHQWTLALASADTSGSGYTNGEKLQDPTGAWVRGTANPGTAARVVDPNGLVLVNGVTLPPAPVLTSLNGVVNGGSYQGTQNLSVQLDTLIGARKVVYDILNGSNAVVATYTKQTSATPYGGYTNAVGTFNLAWDTNDLPNGTYTVRATLSDARAAGLGGARTSIQSVANVTINNPARSLRYVATSGQDLGTCTASVVPCASLNYAISQAQNNDEIRMAAGTYPTGTGAAPLAINVHITIRGGFSTSNWTSADRFTNSTILDGQNQRNILSYSSTASGFTLKDLTVRNGVSASGGGVVVASAAGTFDGVTFSNNTSTGNGGALALGTSSNTTLANVSFINNTAAGSGGAINALSPIVVTNALFANNSAATGSALALNAAGTTTLTYATIAGAGTGGEAVALTGATTSVTLQNSLISGYTTGIRVASASVNLTLQNTLMANDGSNNVATTVSNSGGGSVSGSPIRGLAGYRAAGDYHLGFGAPAIDAATAVPGVSADLDAQLRSFGSAPDLGAYEFLGPNATIGFADISMAISQPSNAVTVVLQLSSPSLATVTVSYATSNDTAIAGTDYVARSGSVTFPAGSQTQSFDISILNPSATQLRSFVIALSNPSGAALTSLSTATVTILPPPDPPRVAVAASVATAHRDGATPGVFTFSRDVNPESALVVHYTVSGSAQPGVDYQPLSGSITIPAGQYETTLLVTPVGGSGNLLVTVTLVADPTYLLGRSAATVQMVGVLSWRTYLPFVLR